MTSNIHKPSAMNEFCLIRKKISLFKSAWTTCVDKEFLTKNSHIICEPLQVIICNCDSRPNFQPQDVDLHTFAGSLSLFIDPSLDSNQPYLDLLHHSVLHSSRLSTNSAPCMVTFADVAAAAGNCDFVQFLFTSLDHHIRHFYTNYYSYRNPAAILQLFIHALNAGSDGVIDFLIEFLAHDLYSDLKISILEACLWLATTDKSLEICFQKLALKFGVNLHDSQQDFSPLRLTCMYENSEMAAYLIDQGADMFAMKSDGNTIAYDAYRYGSYIGQHLVLKTLLDKGLHLDTVLMRYSHFRYPLMYTFIQFNELDLVRYLVKCGHSVNQPVSFMSDDQEHTITPLMLALSCRSVFQCSSSCRCLEVATWLIENGADCNKRSFHNLHLGDESWTPLHMAVTHGDLSSIRTLVEHGAEIDALTASKETVLCIACGQGANLDVIHYLLQLNSPVVSFPGSSFAVRCREKLAQDQQWQLLDLAIYKGNIRLTKMLLLSGHYKHPPRVSSFLGQTVSLNNDMQLNALRYLQEFSSQVLSLQVVCRDRLRRASGSQLLKYLQTTVIPARLRSFLLLENILQPSKNIEDSER